MDEKEIQGEQHVLKDKNLLIVLATAPAGLGHLRVTKALQHGLPAGVTPVLLGSKDPFLTYIHRIMSVHIVLRNVFEWVLDSWKPGYEGAPSDGGPWVRVSLGKRVLRGGAWDAKPDFMRSSARHSAHPGLRYPHVGLRVARDL